MCESKKRVLIINSVCGIGSTGKICINIANQYEQQGYEVKIAYGRNVPSEIPEEYRHLSVRIGSRIDMMAHLVKTRVFDKHGLGNKKSTMRFLKWADEFNPDILWLHNVHGYYINYELLFEWIKRHSQMEVKWTLHDCWSFTGHCSHYVSQNCDKWLEQCFKCPQLNQYPKSIICDNSASNYNRKKIAFSGVQNLTIITPSLWLADQVKQSFLKQYPVEVHNNEINYEVFYRRPAEEIEKIYYKYLGKTLDDINRKIILGVASIWSRKKGLYEFSRLAEMINSIEQELRGDKYAIVLVGLNQKQIKEISHIKYGSDDRCVIYPVMRTENANELACLYSGAEYFVNPTFEDTYPTVNLEAVACGTKVLCYDVGGCRETIGSKDRLFEVGDIVQIVEFILHCEN